MIQTTLTHKVLSKYKNPYFLETGTANGDCVHLALDEGFEKVFSIEIDPLRQEDNIIKYNKYIISKQLCLITGDSLIELKKLIPLLDKPTTFWLDAHVDDGICGIKTCPLYEELDAIASSNIKNHTIMIDDMRIIGKHWGKDITLNTITSKLLQINSNYKLCYEDGYAVNDILIAYCI